MILGVQGRKICKAMDLAVQSGSPIIGLIDFGGARIQEGVYSLGGYGEIFRRNAQYSGVIPQISVIMGPCAGGASYSPALTDLIVMVDKQAFMFLTGPEVIKTVTGEVIDQELLGGADAHFGISGTAHFKAADDKDAIKLVRTILSYLPSNNADNPPVVDNGDDPHRMDEELESPGSIDPPSLISCTPPSSTSLTAALSSNCSPIGRAMPLLAWLAWAA